MSLTTDMLHELLEYNDGKLFWKVSRGRVKAGSEAGVLQSNGYVRVKLNSKSYQAHRLVYMLVHGHIPNNLYIDHIDGNKSNNRIENLRTVTHQENLHNMRNAKGYYKHPCGKWCAQIHRDGTVLNLGLFTHEEEAREAYLEAKKKYHPSTPTDYYA